MIGAASVTVSTAPFQGTGAGSTPSAALHGLIVRPIPQAVAKRLLVRHHYLHSLPGGTRLALGVFSGSHLLGALTLGVGPANAHCLVEGAVPDDCLVLTRLWLSDALPKNSESRVLGVVFRALRKHTPIKFVVTYADPAQGHLGVIYQATGWLYIGLSDPMPLYDVGDGVVRHSRSLSHSYGTHSVRYFRVHGVPIRSVPQAAKYRYVFFLNQGWRERLAVPSLPYPKKETAHERP